MSNIISCKQFRTDGILDGLNREGDQYWIWHNSKKVFVKDRDWIVIRDNNIVTVYSDEDFSFLFSPRLEKSRVLLSYTFSNLAKIIGIPPGLRIVLVRVNHPAATLQLLVEGDEIKPPLFRWIEGAEVVVRSVDSREDLTKGLYLE